MFACKLMGDLAVPPECSSGGFPHLLPQTADILITKNWNWNRGYVKFQSCCFMMQIWVVTGMCCQNFTSCKFKTKGAAVWWFLECFTCATDCILVYKGGGCTLTKCLIFIWMYSFPSRFFFGGGGRSSLPLLAMKWMQKVLILTEPSWTVYLLCARS